jgi:tRNA nucleotidyltransferase (CCA-adding enzyme)
MAEEQNKKVSFHKHEIVGATQTFNFMKRLGFRSDEIEYVVKLVRWHQFRFYEDTNSKTIKKWLQTLGKNDWKDLILLRKADRAGNLKNKDKPIETKELKELIKKCEDIIKNKEIVFIEDLQLKKADLFRLGVSNAKHKEIFVNLLAIVQSDHSKNNKKQLLEYVKQHFLDKSNDFNADSNKTIF